MSNPVKNGPLERAMLGDQWSPWTVGDHLSALMVDALNWLVWSKTEDGAKNRNRPRPVPRPGMNTDEGSEHRRGDPLTAEEAMKLL